MTMPIRTVLEQGPKGRSAVAFALDWPGWSRGGKTTEIALDTLASYRARYRPVAAIAGLDAEFDNAGIHEIVERIEGTGSTDFWGISYASASEEREPMSDELCERKVALLQACWVYFDEVSGRVSAELRRGPRGGGRDRDQIINHTFGAERTQFAKKVGVETPQGVMLTPEGLRAHREAYVEAIREYNAVGKPARTWTLPFLIRHSAYHVLDHAWEMEDKDLTATGS